MYLYKSLVACFLERRKTDTKVKNLDIEAFLMSLNREKSSKCL